MNIDGIFFFLPSPRALLQGLCVTYLCCLISLSRISTIAFRFFLSVFSGKGSLFCAFSRISKRLEIEVEMGKFPRLQN